MQILADFLILLHIEVNYVFLHSIECLHFKIIFTCFVTCLPYAYNNLKQPPLLAKPKQILAKPKQKDQTTKPYDSPQLFKTILFVEILQINNAMPTTGPMSQFMK